MIKVKTIREKMERVAPGSADMPSVDDPSPDISSSSPATSSLPPAVDIPNSVARSAWFIMAHLVLENGSRILDAGCHEGMLTYAMAVMNPQMKFIGIDRDKKAIRKAQDLFSLPNLQFICGDIHDSFIPKNSLDAIINNFTLYEVYSSSGCSEKTVHMLLERQYDMLRQGGQLLIRDHARQSEDLVLIEMPDKPGGQTIADMSESDLLIRYSEQARPRDDENCRGFYLEELPARFPRTRLFRLPAKWAHEFVLRKNNRDSWETELQKEYAFFTGQEFRRTLNGLGMRVLYTAPHWDPQIIKNRFDKKFKLLSEEGTPLGPPPTSFIALATKNAERQSLVLQERKPSKKSQSSFRISAMRDDVTGRLLDVVFRGVETTEILPYRITDTGALNVFVHEGIPRCITNAVPRGVPNLDGKRWSGHMIEALAVPQHILHDMKPGDMRSLLHFSQDYLGLKPEMGTSLEDGPGFYPAPDSIDERIETKYLRIDANSRSHSPPPVIDDLQGFSTRGHLKEIDAQIILNAIGVGLIPSSRLEIQILALYQKMNIPYQSWTETPLILQEEHIEDTTKLDEIVRNLAMKDHRFKEVRGNAGQLKTIQSVFVDEGQTQSGGITGLASKDMSFVIPQQESLNVAVVLPLTKKINGEVMAGVIEQFLPVPQRYKGNGYILTCPSLALPKDITNMELARKYIAEKFEVQIDCVSKMGESYFCHAGVTPRRIYPFAVSTAGSTGWRKIGRTHGPTKYCPLYHLNELLYLDNYYSFMRVVALAYRSGLGLNSEHSPRSDFSHSRVQALSQPIALKASEVDTFYRPFENSPPGR